MRSRPRIRKGQRIGRGRGQIGAGVQQRVGKSGDRRGGEGKVERDKVQRGEVERGEVGEVRGSPEQRLELI